MANPSSIPAPRTSSASGRDEASARTGQAGSQAGRRTKVAVLISGRGSNMAALIEAAAIPGYPAEIVLVLSNKAEAGGLAITAAAGIATAVVPHRGYKDRESFDRAMTAAIEASGAEIVCLAGFMRLLSPWFCRHWQGRLINIHPALLPSFKGLDTHARALAAGVKIHGATVHFVIPEMDEGPIIAQGAVPVLPDDDEAALAARVLAVEHRLYPAALAAVATGAARMVENRCVMEPHGPKDAALIVPAAG